MKMSPDIYVCRDLLSEIFTSLNGLYGQQFPIGHGNFPINDQGVWAGARNILLCGTNDPILDEAIALLEQVNSLLYELVVQQH